MEFCFAIALICGIVISRWETNERIRKLEYKYKKISKSVNDIFELSQNKDDEIKNRLKKSLDEIENILRIDDRR